MTTIDAARDAIAKVVDDGWAADPLTTGLTLLWDDVDGDRPGYDANQKPVAYGRATIQHLSGGTETIGGEGIGKEEQLGQVVVQVFGPKGRGYKTASKLAQVVKRFFQRKRIPNVEAGWFFDVSATEERRPGPWDQFNVTAQFRYSESVG